VEVSGQLHATAALPPGKEPRYPLDRRLGGLQRWSGHDGENTSQPLLGMYKLTVENIIIFSDITLHVEKLILRVSRQIFKILKNVSRKIY
jgi:hypothetical protein